MASTVAEQSNEHETQTAASPKARSTTNNRTDEHCRTVVE